MLGGGWRYLRIFFRVHSKATCNAYKYIKSGSPTSANPANPTATIIVEMATAGWVLLPSLPIMEMSPLMNRAAEKMSNPIWIILNTRRNDV